jgi:hypothetical protein
MRGAVLLALTVLAADAAEAGAWTLEKNHMAVFAGATASTASRRYDNDGASATRVVFRKLLFQNWVEYGLLDSVTLFAVPEYVIAKSGMDGSGTTNARSASIEGGVRILLLSRGGMLSVQASAKSAGAFDMSVSTSGEAGRQFETRLLYGRSFKLFKRDAFIDIEAAQRWIARPRPDELAFDGTFGWWLTRDNLLLVQSFNFMTTGPVRPPYQPYVLSKLQVSLVQKLSRRWSFQPGYFMSLTGRNIVKESGVVATLWFQT